MSNPSPSVKEQPLPAVSARCQVRTRREQLGLRASELAVQAGITRQALHSVETGAYVPNTLVALRLARVLDCSVEELFSLAHPGVQATLMGGTGQPAAPGSRGTRVQLAQVGGTRPGDGMSPDEPSPSQPSVPWLAFPLSGQAGWGQLADGVVLGQDSAGLADIRLFTDLTLARRSAVLVGCDPALELAARHVAQHSPGVRLLWHPASSLQALQAVARGQAHAAGIHLWEASTRTSNLGAVERELADQRAHLYTLWSWEQGLMVAPGNPLGLSGSGGLLLPGLRLVNRGAGAGSRALLDAWLDDLGVSAPRRRQLNGYGDEAPGHLEAAGRVAAGLADAAPGPRSAAQALGLDFVPIQRERFDLVIPDAHLDHPAIAALIAVARQGPFRAELAALGGYDPAHAGEWWQSTA